MLNFPELEEKILRFWKEKDIFKKTLAKKSAKGPFTFYEGPPTANGKPGIHHVLARAFKDLIPRYKTMQGFLVERKAGWDTHGLPVELEVEKKLKISGKPDIEKYGVAEFNKKCQQSVWQYQEDWEKLTERIGFWLDLANPYITYHKEYIETLWWIFKEVYERGLLYHGHKVVPQCPRCGTALSSHEVAQGYQAITEPSLYLKFKVTKGNKLVEPGDFILSWTTTPWTLPGNVALAVGKDFTYYRLGVGNEHYLVARKCVEVIDQDYEILAKLKGVDLVGLKYQPLFPGAIPAEIENLKNAFKVYAADFVTTTEGTGIVHTAVMYGEDDYQLGSKARLPKYHTVDENGRFILSSKHQETSPPRSAPACQSGREQGRGNKQIPNPKSQIPNTLEKLYERIDGQFVKDKTIEGLIVESLKERGLLYKIEDYTHDYPFCWRCDAPLLYYAKDSWFFEMSKKEIREQLIKENKKINWLPAHIKEGRFGEWLAQVKDWAISRERYWGTPLPIWQCAKCQEIKVIGSYQELYQETGCPLVKQADFDPHRPFIDEYKLKCRCGGEMWRVKEVADCWFDSGAMPFAQYHYPFANKEKIESAGYYPADFIAEAIDQTRGWFYTLLAIGVLIGRGTSYKNVVCLGHINDKDGQKMSKSRGNVVDPWEVINQWGADALRFHLYTINQPGESKNFDIKNVESVVRKNFIILFNVLSFYLMYDEGIIIPEQEPKLDNILDQWIIARLNELIVEITAALDRYDIFTAGRSLSIFIDDLSTWYLRRSRERFKRDQQQDKQLAVKTLGYCLLTLAKLLAPFTPFMAEELYQKLKGAKESVHLEDWPLPQEIDVEAIENMKQVREIVELALAKRDQAGLKVRQPLNRLTVSASELNNGLAELIKDEINVKKVVFKKGKTLAVELDTEITDELKEEGLYRELVRTINQLRKEEGLTIQNFINLFYYTDSDFIDKVINKYKDNLLKNTISRNIQKHPQPGIRGKEIEINNNKVWIGIKL